MSGDAREMTSDELTAMASRYQRSQLFIAGLENPPIIFSGQINQSFTTHDMIHEFEFDNVVDGDYTDVEPNMTVYIGSAIGLSDIGIARIRKVPTADTLYIGETSEIDFANNIFFTVVDEMLPNPRHSKVISKETFYDVDIEYDDQNENYDPVPIMGSNGVVDVAEYPVEIRFPNIADSWVFDSTITDYLLESNFGTVTDEDTTNPLLTLTSYPTGGRVRVKLTVTADNGKSFTGYRYIYIYDVDNRPFEVFNLNQCVGDYDSGYWSYEVQIFRDAGLDTIRNRSHAILFTKDYYDNEQVSFSQLEHRENIVCEGWVLGESIDNVPSKKGYVQFRVEGLGFYLSRIPSFLPALRMAVDTPLTWEEVPSLTVDKAVYHLLHWHSTVSALFDYYPTNDERMSGSFPVTSPNIWEQVQNILSLNIFARACSDRYNRVFTQTDPQLVPVAERTWERVMTITRSMWKNRINLRRRVITQKAQLDLSGINVNSSSNSVSYYALSNGHVYRTFGNPDMIDKILVDDQAHLISLAGLAMSVENMEFESYDVELAANNRMVDIAPRMKLGIEIAEEDTIRGVAYDGDAVPQSVSFVWNPSSGLLRTVIELENETVPELAMIGDIPEETGYGDFDFSNPPSYDIEVPSFPSFEIPAEVINPNHPKTVVVGSNVGVFYTKTFHQPDPDNAVIWLEMNASLTTQEKQEIAQLVTTPSGALYIMTGGYSGSSGGWDSIYRAGSLGSSWVKVFDATTYSPTAKISGLGVNPTRPDHVAIVVGENFINFGGLDTHKIYVGTNGSFSAGGFVRLKYNYYQKGIVFWRNNWVVVGHRPLGIGGSLAGTRFWTYDVGGSLSGNQDGVAWGSGSGATVGDCHAIASVNLVLWGGNTTSDYSIVADLAGASITNVFSTVQPTIIQQIAISPTNVKAMGNDGTTPYKSIDSLITWASMGGTLPIGSDVWENCKDDSRWIFGGGSTIKLTTDAGLTQSDKHGNLPFIAPTIDIKLIRYING